MKLTKSRIDQLKPTGKDVFIWDDDIPGFGIRMSPKGIKTYMVQYRHGGRTRRVSIGRTDRVTADKARKAAQIMFGEIASGKNPALDAQKRHCAPTLKIITERFLSEHVEVKLKPSTQADYRRIIKNHILPNLGSYRITDITRNNISALHLKLKDTPYRANCVIRVLSKIFNLCEEWGLLKNGSNPCRHIKPYNEKSRNRFLSREELSRLWDTLATAQENGLASAYAVSAFKLLILTGCRYGEIRTLKWSYIKGTRIEFPDSKTGYKRIPFNADAMRVLAATERKPDNEYVICGDVPGQPIINLQKSWRRIRAAAGLDDVRIHDLRHTFASHAVMGGTPLAIVGKLLGHSQIATTMRYAHLADTELADASEGIGRLLNHSHARRVDSNVVPIRRVHE